MPTLPSDPGSSSTPERSTAQGPDVAPRTPQRSGSLTSLIQAVRTAASAWSPLSGPATPTAVADPSEPSHSSQTCSDTNSAGPLVVTPPDSPVSNAVCPGTLDQQEQQQQQQADEELMQQAAAMAAAQLMQAQQHQRQLQQVMLHQPAVGSVPDYGMLFSAHLAALQMQQQVQQQQQQQQRQALQAAPSALSQPQRRRSLWSSGPATPPQPAASMQEQPQTSAADRLPLLLGGGKSRHLEQQQQQQQQQASAFVPVALMPLVQSPTGGLMLDLRAGCALQSQPQQQQQLQQTTLVQEVTSREEWAPAGGLLQQQSAPQQLAALASWCVQAHLEAAALLLRAWAGLVLLTAAGGIATTGLSLASGAAVARGAGELWSRLLGFWWRQGRVALHGARKVWGARDVSEVAQLLLLDTGRPAAANRGRGQQVATRGSSEGALVLPAVVPDAISSSTAAGSGASGSAASGSSAAPEAAQHASRRPSLAESSAYAAGLWAGLSMRMGCLVAKVPLQAGQTCLRAGEHAGSACVRSTCTQLLWAGRLAWAVSQTSAQQVAGAQVAVSQRVLTSAVEALLGVALAARAGAEVSRALAAGAAKWVRQPRAESVAAAVLAPLERAAAGTATSLGQAASRMQARDQRAVRTATVHDLLVVVLRHLAVALAAVSCALGAVGERGAETAARWALRRAPPVTQHMVIAYVRYVVSMLQRMAYETGHLAVQLYNVWREHA